MMPAKDRILNKILVHENGCWNWIGAVRKGSNQYGRLTIGSRKDGTRKSVSAHRLAYETFIGPVADGLCVCHKCDNPSCVNPKHLFLGTLKDNSDDRDAKGRNSPPPRINRNQHPQAKLTDAQLHELLTSGEPSRAAARRYGLADRYVRQLRAEKTPTPPAGEKP